MKFTQLLILLLACLLSVAMGQGQGAANRANNAQANRPAGEEEQEEEDSYDAEGQANRPENSGSTRTSVCHFSQDDQNWKKLEVDQNGALNGHLNHGDYMPDSDLDDGSGHLDADCVFTPTPTSADPNEGSASRANNGDAQRASFQIPQDEEEEEEEVETVHYTAYGDGGERPPICPSESTATCHDMITAGGVHTGGVCVDVADNALKITVTAVDEYALVRTQVWAGTDIEGMPTQEGSGVPDTAKFPHYQCTFWGESENKWVLPEQTLGDNCPEGVSEFTVTVVTHSQVSPWNANGKADTAAAKLEAFAGAVTDQESFDITISCDCPTDAAERRQLQPKRNLRSRKAPKPQREVTPIVTRKPHWLV